MVVIRSAPIANSMPAAAAAWPGPGGDRRRGAARSSARPPPPCPGSPAAGRPAPARAAPPRWSGVIIAAEQVGGQWSAVSAQAATCGCWLAAPGRRYATLVPCSCTSHVGGVDVDGRTGPSASSRRRPAVVGATSAGRLRQPGSGAVPALGCEPGAPAPRRSRWPGLHGVTCWPARCGVQLVQPDQESSLLEPRAGDLYGSTLPRRPRACAARTGLDPRIEGLDQGERLHSSVTASICSAVVSDGHPPRPGFLPWLRPRAPGVNHHRALWEVLMLSRLTTEQGTVIRDLCAVSPIHLRIRD